ncbi:cytochrome c-type biogenesis protein [Methylomonas sp. MED-D]|uniref:cytochrome c-type biogenesis protein n=1 Tax=unclassified Methylomonas TaxID=2608980 RepID=UPI001438EF12|nr:MULTISPECIES: cytochrome c-type biogenesis protein [unclassified Methylomonas]MDT4328399.1 cytochrome c-type biogenesis protein [Methylomonas sp. MV1]NJA06405.1 cytochrome c-type biogenesis protein CcmH [Methylococcaceae bacterium WWC4]WGS88302.1 cytochrome c-type biogenesis protein CcmH [Methylomonas sp. UP202]
MKRAALLSLMLMASTAFAAVEYRDFSQPEQEQVYQTLISELRCLVCQNQTIADSNADLAKDLREQVYQMLRQGKSRADVVNFMTERYGDFVMYKPAFNLKTVLLWLGPALFLGGGLITVILVARRKRTGRATELDAAQKARLQKLLGEGEDA